MARVIGRGAFGRDASGTSVLEFALCAPLFILLLLVGVDTVRYMSATRQVEDVATTIGQMISVEQDGAISSKDLQFYHDAAMVIFPQVLADAAQQSKTWDKDIGISVASIQFTASSPTCKAKCTYVAKVLWAGGTTPRSCSVRPTAVADTAGPSSTTLPTSVYGAGSIIVVDVSFSFRPTIAPRFMPTLPIRRSYYVAPRYTPTITYADAAGGTGFAHAC